MDMEHDNGKIPYGVRRTALPRRRPPGQTRPSALDWPAWLTLIERQRKMVSRTDGQVIQPPPDYFVAATCATFRMDGIDLTEQEVLDAVIQNAAQRKLRSRACQRIRNHVAILHSIEIGLRHGLALKSAAVVRWYTSISSGLSMPSLSADKMTRIEQIVGRINSPQLRLQPAIQEVARTYAELIEDPLFPSFNGLLARLLLRYHLGRCNLPFVVLEENGDQSLGAMSLRLLNAIDQTYQSLIS